MNLCAGTRQDGKPCTIAARSNSPYCWAHAPELADQRRAGHAAGGRAKAAPRRLERLTPVTIRPVVATLLSALAKVESGAITPSQGSAMSSIASALVRCYELAQLESTLEETQARLAALERGPVA